ncbi:transmembrane protein 256 homolog [Babylonia areolata]|uniref:transmembrane protein 256 homolog n=1 Tax=Babylonia areolata TaxID=304850 RepID=UPI003FD29407
MSGLWTDITGIFSEIYRVLPGVPAPKEIEKVVIKEVDTMIQRRSFVRIAGLSGALAIAMAAYGAHGMSQEPPDSRLRTTFMTGNRMHLINSVALLASPLARRPVLVGTLLTVGMVLFSGSCYYHALTGNQQVRYVTPYGGILLIVGWLAMAL